MCTKFKFRILGGEVAGSESIHIYMHEKRNANDLRAHVDLSSRISSLPCSGFRADRRISCYLCIPLIECPFGNWSIPSDRIAKANWRFIKDALKFSKSAVRGLLAMAARWSLEKSECWFNTLYYFLTTRTSYSDEYLLYHLDLAQASIDRQCRFYW